MLKKNLFQGTFLGSPASESRKMTEMARDSTYRLGQFCLREQDGQFVPGLEFFTNPFQNELFWDAIISLHRVGKDTAILSIFLLEMDYTHYINDSEKSCKETCLIPFFPNVFVHVIG